MSSISRWLTVMCLIKIYHGTILTHETYKTGEKELCDGSGGRQACEWTKDVDNNVMKNGEEARTGEWMTLPENEAQLQDLYLKGKRHPAMMMAHNAMLNNRSPNQAFILLVGRTGSGKSSTINYLLDTKLAETGDSESVTHSTTEYIVKLKSNEWRIPDLNLSIIDTPGFDDTNGLKQDARNIMSIKYFLQSHPHIRKNSYPNLVMVIQNIQDNRMGGEKSHFVQMLKGVDKSNVVDSGNPNVVVVLTHATSIARNPKYWEEEVQKKKDEVNSIVRHHLGIYPEIVVQENMPEKNDLKRIGDWYLLPNGDKQPKILYEACERILNRADDKIGHEAMAVAFRSGMDKKVVKGHTVSSLDVTSEDAQGMFSILAESIVMVNTSEVSDLLENYKREKKGKSIDYAIFRLQLKLQDLQIFKASDLGNISMNTLMNKLYPFRITEEIQKVLKDLFGLSYEQSAGIDYHVGKGYNIFKDAATLISPLVMEERRTQYGLPDNVRLTECSSFEIKYESINDAKAYVSERLKELKLDVQVSINLDAFNIKFLRDNNKNSSKMQIFSVEQRIQKVIIKTPFVTNEEFKTDVKMLPSDFDLSVEYSMMKWTAFFDKWGMYVVTGAFIGGSVTGKIKVEEGQSVEEVQTALDAKFAFLQRDKEMSFSKADKHNSFQKEYIALHSKSLQWNGGNKKTYKTSLEHIEQSDWNEWVESLEYSPVPLWSSLELYPLYHIVNDLSQEKSITMQKAMNLAMKGKFIFQPPELDNRENTGKSNSAPSCFHGDSLVELHNGNKKRIKSLRVGDKVLVLDSKGSLVEDEIIAWLHRLTAGQFTFLKIIHDLGEFIVTPDHILFVGKNRHPQHASTVNPGNKLYLLLNATGGNEISMATILSIQTVKGIGVYAPLTYNGRLLVDNVDVSCYSTLDQLQIMGHNIMSSHALAHLAFLPLRIAFTLGFDTNQDKNDDATGVHSYARWLMGLYWT